jgi:hypothetical protein
MNRIEILSPVSLGAGETREPTAGLESLAGRRLGIRRDRTWRSFEIFAEELDRLARDRLGVAEVVMFDAGVRIGTTEEEKAKIAGFASQVDAAVVGLGT